ncbi:MAG: LexA family transcriptional regulator [Neisseriaceae bacterium]|nr:LexA family transcriptional regulator [Neisseriaceae bacterium]
MNRVEIVRKLIDERFGGNQSAFARAIGKTPTHIYQWLNGIRNIGDGTARQIEKALGLPNDYLFNPSEKIELIKKPKIKLQQEPQILCDMFGVPDECVKNHIPPQSPIAVTEEYDYTHTHLMIARYEVNLSAGNGTAQWIEQKNKDPLIFRQSWFDKHHFSPNDLRAMTVKGDSMTPVLENGDTVIIDISDTEIIDGEIYAVAFKEKLYIKELRHTENGISMISKNSDYEVMHINEKDAHRFFVLGRKVWRGG